MILESIIKELIEEDIARIEYELSLLPKPVNWEKVNPITGWEPHNDNLPKGRGPSPSELEIRSLFMLKYKNGNIHRVYYEDWH